MSEKPPAAEAYEKTLAIVTEQKKCGLRTEFE
jgi:hypothetical protein